MQTEVAVASTRLPGEGGLHQVCATGVGACAHVCVEPTQCGCLCAWCLCAQVRAGCARVEGVRGRLAAWLLQGVSIRGICRVWVSGEQPSVHPAAPPTHQSLPVHPALPPTHPPISTHSPSATTHTPISSPPVTASIPLLCTMCAGATSAGPPAANRLPQPGQTLPTLPPRQPAPQLPGTHAASRPCTSFGPAAHAVTARPVRGGSAAAEGARREAQEEEGEEEEGEQGQAGWQAGPLVAARSPPGRAGSGSTQQYALPASASIPARVTSKPHAGALTDGGNRPGRAAAAAVAAEAWEKPCRSTSQGPLAMAAQVRVCVCPCARMCLCAHACSWGGQDSALRVYGSRGEVECMIAQGTDSEVHSHFDHTLSNAPCTGQPHEIVHDIKHTMHRPS